MEELEWGLHLKWPKNLLQKKKRTVMKIMTITISMMMQGIKVMINLTS